MKNIINKSLLGILSAGMMFGSSLIASEKKDFENLKVFKDIDAKITGQKLITKNTDLYLVKGIDGSGRPFDVVVTGEGDYLVLSSKVLEVNTGNQIKIPLDISILKDQEAFTYGTGKKHYYVFTDPQCPFCKRFKTIWPKIKDDVTLHVFFYNLASHQEADDMTRWVLAGKSDEEKANRLFKVTNGDKEYTKAKITDKQMAEFNKLLNKHSNFALRLGVKGVPSVIDENGESIAWPSLQPKK